MQFCENYLQKKTFLWLSKMPSPLGQASPACQWIRRSSWRWWVLAGSFPDSRGQVQLSGGGQTREHHLPKGGRSLESCCGWSPEFFPPSELWPAVTRGSASWVKHTTVNGQTRLQQSYCKPYLRKPLLVDVIHHNNLMVVTRWRSSRAEKFIRLKSVTKKSNNAIHVCETSEGLSTWDCVSGVAWPPLCGIHPRRCSRCRSAWRGSAVHQV